MALGLDPITYHFIVLSRVNIRSRGEDEAEEWRGGGRPAAPAENVIFRLYIVVVLVLFL